MNGAKTLLICFTYHTQTTEGSGYCHFSWFPDPAGTSIQTCLDNIIDTVIRPQLENSLGGHNCQNLKAIITSLQDITGVLINESAEAAPYLLGGSSFKISINGEGGTYAFDKYPELDGKWVALVDATDDLHLERVPVAQPKKNVLVEILRQKAVLKPLYNVGEDRMDVLLGTDSYQSLKEQTEDLAYIRDQSVVEDRVEGMRIRQLSHPTDLIMVTICP